MAKEKTYIAAFTFPKGVVKYMTFYAESLALARDHANYCSFHGLPGSRSAPVGAASETSVKSVLSVPAELVKAEMCGQLVENRDDLLNS